MSIINSILKAFVGDKSEKDVKAIQPLINKVKSFESALQALSHDELRAKTAEFKAKIQSARAEKDAKIASLKQDAEQTQDIDAREDIYAEIDKIEKEAYEISEKVLNEILPEAFAVVKETARRFKENTSITVTATPKDRELSATKSYIAIEGDNATWANSWNAAGKAITWDMIHYDVQLIGGVVLHQGKIAEMQTGEGKTLVATLPLYLNALTGNGVHLVTVNDYLAKRDSTWKAPLFEFHGMTVDCIDNHQPNSPERRKAYNADITYGTNNEFGFDYLRDNMAHAPEDLVQRKHNYAIVDEVDSVLIDDARTPLIISGPVPQGDRHEFLELKPKVENLVSLQRKLATDCLTEAKRLFKEGNTKDAGFNLYRSYRALPKSKALIKFLSEEGVKQLLQKTENYYMQDNNREMPKIDEALYFVIEEKNNQVELTDNGIQFLSTDTDSQFFVLPDIGTGIAQIERENLSPEEAAEKKEELFRDFSVKSERIHTLTQLLKAYTLFEKDTEYVIMDNKVMIVDEQTGRIMDGRRYSDGLHQAIEAKENVKIEAATQTFATVTLQNYFRMYSKLGGMTGTASTEAGEFWEIYKLDVVEIPTNRPMARKDKDDLIYRTVREKFNAVIEDVVQLSNAGRPVLIGTTSVEISELLSRMLKIRGIQHNVLNAKMHKSEAEIVAEAGKPGVVTIATNMAGRGTDIKLSDEVKKAGGLAIIGTERHDSRRVDRQLRGRAGRQGDVGSSQFFVSLEDNLMRLFGSDRIAKVMDRLGMEEGEVIQHSMITSSIERAQKKVEENNFGIRKRLLEYDDVMNYQRNAIYKRRQNALLGERLSLDIVNILFDVCRDIATQFTSYDDFELKTIELLGMEPPFDASAFNKLNNDQRTEQLFLAAEQHYKSKNEVIASQVIQVAQEAKQHGYSGIQVPISNGQMTTGIVVDADKTISTQGKEVVKEMEKFITLSLIDQEWKEHLREMDDLKQSVQNAVFEQKDPLLIYKFESVNLFQRFVSRVNMDTISFVIKAEIPAVQQTNQSTAKAPKEKAPKLQMSKDDAISSLLGGLAGAQEEYHDPSTPSVERAAPRQAIKIADRNQRVTVQYADGSIKEDVKYKTVEQDVDSGRAVVIA